MNSKQVTTKQEIIALAKQLGAFSCGVAPFRRYDELLPRLQRRGWVPFVRQNLQQRVDPFLLMPEGKSIIVCLFPYGQGDNVGVARYARGEDYHVATKRMLNQLCDAIGQHRFKVLVDSGTLCDRHLAYLAGLGYYGTNNLLYADGIGSFFTIGSILTDLELAPDAPLQKTCLKCNRCISACPGGALDVQGELNAALCASYLTQTKEPLTEQQQAIVNKSGLTLGCDCCAEVCPLNGENDEQK